MIRGFHDEEDDRRPCGGGCHAGALRVGGRPGRWTEPRFRTGLPAVIAGGREYELTLATEAFASMITSEKSEPPGFHLPRLRVFDHDGRLLRELVGYSNQLPKLLAETIQEPKPVTGGSSLSDALSELRMAAGRPPQVSDLGAADFYILTYEAEWCVPCKEQLKEIREFAAAHHGARFDLLRVDADLRKVDDETRKRIFETAARAHKQP
jgi:hypothetical protein